MRFAKATALLMSLSIVGMSLCACSAEPEPVSSDINIISTQAQNSQSVTETTVPFVFDYNNFLIGTPLDESKLPDDIDVRSQASCASVEMVPVYFTESFEIELKSENDNTIVQIRFLDDRVSTPEGLHIGSTVDEAKSAYGDEPAIETSGAMQYLIDSYGLQLEFDNTGKITKIFYFDPNFV